MTNSDTGLGRQCLCAPDGRVTLARCSLGSHLHPPLEQVQCCLQHAHVGLNPQQQHLRRSRHGQQRQRHCQTAATRLPSRLPFCSPLRVRRGNPGFAHACRARSRPHLLHVRHVLGHVGIHFRSHHGEQCLLKDAVVAGGRTYAG